MSFFKEEMTEDGTQNMAPIVIVERGGCTFVTKVRNIARAGGKGVIIIDSMNENVTEVTMGDDGTGAGLRIPAIMIGKKDGNEILSFMNDT
jgi:extracellular elastinolytic metalloproteinase